MKKFALMAVAFICTISSSSIQAQNTSELFRKGQSMVQLGIGIGGAIYTGSVNTPPLQARFEHGINDEISVGGIVGYTSSTSNYSFGNIEYAHLMIGVRGNYHFSNLKKIDPYAGATLGYHNISLKDKTTNVDYSFGTIATSTVLYGVQVGANYYFTQNIGAWAELGYGVGILNLGITLRF